MPECRLFKYSLGVDWVWGPVRAELGSRSEMYLFWEWGFHLTYWKSVLGVEGRGLARELVGPQLINEDVQIWVWKIIGLCRNMISPYWCKVIKLLHFSICTFFPSLISRGTNLLKVTDMFGFEYIQDLTKYLFCRFLLPHAVSLFIGYTVQ